MEKSAISRLAELFVLLDREHYNPTFVNNTTEFIDEELKEVRNFLINNLKENAVEIVDHLITSCNGPIAKKYNIENKLNLLSDNLYQVSQQVYAAQGYASRPDPQVAMQANQGTQACPPTPIFSALVSMCNDIKNEVRYEIADPYNKLTKSKDELRKTLCNIQGRVTIARYYVPDYIKEASNIVCLIESNDFQERNKQQEFMCMVNGLVEGIKEYSSGYNCDIVLDFRSHMSPDDNEKLRDVITNCVKTVYSLLSELRVVGIPPYCIYATKEIFERKLKEAFEQTHRMNPSEFVRPTELIEYKKNLALSVITEDILFEDLDPKNSSQFDDRDKLTFITDCDDTCEKDVYVPKIVPLYPGRVAVIVDRDAFIMEENKE